MIMNRVQTNQLGLAATAWYLGYLEALESRDISRYANYLADDVDMRFNDAPPIEGKKAVIDNLDSQWRCFDGIIHEVLNILGSDMGFVAESLNHYTKHDGQRITARTVVFTDRNDNGSVAAIRVYSDTSPILKGADSH